MTSNHDDRQQAAIVFDHEAMEVGLFLDPTDRALLLSAWLHSRGIVQASADVNTVDRDINLHKNSLREAREMHANKIRPAIESLIARLELNFSQRAWIHGLLAVHLKEAVV
jgi:hypothetical protein